jgi:UDP-GlcNAc:undecaprenyl-phosphate GlcNAc-1-phosphate transferase
VDAALIQHAPLILSAFLVAAAVVAWFVPHVRTFATRVGAVSRGGGQHGRGVRVHRGAMPNIGGVAIYTGFLLAVLLGGLVAPNAIAPFRVELLAIILGATLMTLVGLIDDLYEVAPALRLGAQIAAAGILVVNGVTIDFVTNYFGVTDFVFIPQAAAAVITIVWVVGFVNAFNFIDGLDGLSSGIAAIASLSLLAVAMQFPDRGASLLLLAAVAGSALGFLRHNSNPASIHMGDSGAYFLGFVLAAVSVLGALKVTAAVTVVAPIVVLALPVLNITQVTVRRLRRGQDPMLASNDHLHDLLRQRSGSPRVAVYTLWTGALACGVLGMLASSVPAWMVMGTLVGSVVLLVGVSYLRWREFRADESLQPQA